jgi:hypothetical protein
MAKARDARASKERGVPSLALVFGYIAVKDLVKKADWVAVLSRLGYGNREIATICDTTPAAVATWKSAGKKRGKTGKKKRK